MTECALLRIRCVNACLVRLGLDGARGSQPVWPLLHPTSSSRLQRIVMIIWRLYAGILSTSIFRTAGCCKASWESWSVLLDHTAS